MATGLNTGGRIATSRIMPRRQTKRGAARLGRRGDTILAHINPEEARLLKRRGGSGTRNPFTGLREYWQGEGDTTNPGEPGPGAPGGGGGVGGGGGWGPGQQVNPADPWGNVPPGAFSGLTGVGGMPGSTSHGIVSNADRKGTVHNAPPGFGSQSMNISHDRFGNPVATFSPNIGDITGTFRGPHVLGQTDIKSEPLAPGPENPAGFRGGKITGRVTDDFAGLSSAV